MSLLEFLSQPALGGPGDVCGFGVAGLFAAGSCPQLIGIIDSQLRPNEPRYWGPWTHRPYCEGDWCAHTNALLSCGQGISVITHRSGEQEAAAALDVLGHDHDEASCIGVQGTQSTSKYSPLSDDNHDRLYEVRETKGKDQGVFAARIIPRGSVVMMDNPIMLKLESLAGDLNNGDIFGSQRSRLFDRAATQLSDPDRVLGLAQHEGFAGSEAENAANYNSFQVGFGNGTYSAVFPRVSVSVSQEESIMVVFQSEWSETLGLYLVKGPMLINLNNKLPSEVVTKNIDTDDLDHIPMGPDWDFHHRQAELSDNWNFNCACSLCSASARQRQASDERRRQFAALAKRYHGLNHHDPEGSLQAVQALEQAMAINAQEPMLTSTVPLLLEAAWTAYRGGHTALAGSYVEKMNADMMARGFKDEGDENSLRQVKELLYRG